MPSGLEFTPHSKSSIPSNLILKISERIYNRLKSAGDEVSFELK